MKRSKCQCEKLVERKITNTIPLGGEMVKVEDAPARVCLDCGEIYFDGRYIVNLEKKLLRRAKQAA